jgi:hypothetical protein
MDLQQFYQVLGYTSSGVIAVSLMMRSVTKLRAINLVGSIGFTSYGLLVGAYPVALLNAVIIVINLYHLRHFLPKVPLKRNFKNHHDLKTSLPY